MSPADAAMVIATVLREEGLSGAASKVTPARFADQKLDVLEMWMNADMDGMPYKKAIRTLAEIADEFVDSFPAQTAAKERQDAIREANQGKLDGKDVLKRGWQRIRIPGRSVDLFQANTHAILTSLGCKPAWIDTWYYHTVRRDSLRDERAALRAEGTAELVALRPAFRARFLRFVA